MITGSFDPVTSREVLGDSFSRSIEEKARKDADNGNFDPPSVVGLSYWDKAQKEFQVVIYKEQYHKRLARNARKTGD